MSQMTATARPLRVPRRGPAAPPLRVMPKGIATTGNGGFATLCLVVLTLGLIALLLLNTALAQGSLALGQLQRESTTVQNDATNLREQISAASASGTLARTATKMGMVRSNERAYIDLATGKVTGTAYPATTYQAFSVVTSPTPPPPFTASDQKLLTTVSASVLATLATLAPKKATADGKPADAATSAKPSIKPSAKPSATPKTPGATASAAAGATLGSASKTPPSGATGQPRPQTPATR